MIYQMFIFQFTMLFVTYTVLDNLIGDKMPFQRKLLLCLFRSLAFAASMAEIISFPAAFIIAIFVCAPLSKFIYNNYLVHIPITKENN